MESHFTCRMPRALISSSSTSFPRGRNEKSTVQFPFWCIPYTFYSWWKISPRHCRLWSIMCYRYVQFVQWLWIMWYPLSLSCCCTCSHVGGLGCIENVFGWVKMVMMCNVDPSFTHYKTTPLLPTPLHETTVLKHNLLLPLYLFHPLLSPVTVGYVLKPMSLLL